MPDKHEVGGSSPLGPTKQVKTCTKTEKSNTLYGGVAQLGEHLPCKQGVMGSNPIISTKDSERSPKKRIGTEKPIAQRIRRGNGSE